MRMSDSKLRKRVVISSDGHAVGEISSLAIDTETWRVESLQISLRKEISEQIGISHGLFRGGSLTVPVQVVKSVGDAVLLSESLAQLRDSRESTIDATGGIPEA